MYLYLYLCLYLYLYLYQLVPYLTYLSTVFLYTYLLYAGTTSAGNHSFIHSFIHSLPPSLPVAGLVYVCVCTCASIRPCISVYLSVCMYIHTTYSTLAYPQKVHIKDTYQRYISKIHIKDTCPRVSWGMWLFLILKIYLPIRSTQKTTRRTSVHPPCLSQTSLGEFYVQAKAKFPFSNWRPKTTVCLASYLR